MVQYFKLDIEGPEANLTLYYIARPVILKSSIKINIKIKH